MSRSTITPSMHRQRPRIDPPRSDSIRVDVAADAEACRGAIRTKSRGACAKPARRRVRFPSAASNTSSSLQRLLVALLIGSQLLLTFFRGQDLPLEAVTNATVRGTAVEFFALHEHDELHERGLHQHDGLPIHLHVPEDDFNRRWTGKSFDHGIDQTAAIGWHAPAPHPSPVLTLPRPPRGIASAPPREVDRSIRSFRLLI